MSTVLPIAAGWGWVGALAALALLALVALAVLGLVRSDGQHRVGSGPSTSALRVIEERYARGEVSREEFLERRDVLRRSR